jgi:hypothetical protein
MLPDERAGLGRGPGSDLPPFEDDDFAGLPPGELKRGGEAIDARPDHDHVGRGGKVGCSIQFRVLTHEGNSRR